MSRRILIAGIGNIFMGDDGFGCEVVRQLEQRRMPAGVSVVDFGIRGMDLGYAIMDGYDVVILVDAIDRAVTPGTVYVIEPEIDEIAADRAAGAEQLVTPHEMDPAKVLRLVASLGEARPRLLLVACQPEFLGGDHGHMGLSAAVGAAVEHAVTEVEHLLGELACGKYSDRHEYQRVSTSLLEERGSSGRVS